MKKKKHVFACLFMAVAIAASVPLGINRSLSRVREDAAGQYYYDEAGYALYDGIEKRQDAASSLITLAERYAGQEPSLQKLIDELDYRVQASRNAYDDDDTFAKEVKANQALDAPAQELAQALQNINLAEKDQKYPAQLIDQMKSEQDKLIRSSYNDAARDYNAKLQQLKPFAMLDAMATFDQETAAEYSAEAEDTTVVQEDTRIPSPPEAPQAPDAPGDPDLDTLIERTENFAESTAGNAVDFADEIAGWAEDLGDEIANQVTEAFGG